jgi:hypothetical protein
MKNLEQLPKKSRKLLEHYCNLSIGDKSFPCPYFQNIARRKDEAVFVGKGLPEDIEKKALMVFEEAGKDPHKYSVDRLRLYLVMASLGIDCSGFVVRLLHEHAKEIGFRAGIAEILTVPEHYKEDKEHYLQQPFTKISAKHLTSPENTTNISDLQDIRVGDLIGFLGDHVAIITSVSKEKGSTVELKYHHSTSEYMEQHGVRAGSIRIIKENAGLEEQEWTETLRGKNYTFDDYRSAPTDTRGIKRILAYASQGIYHFLL